MEIKTYDTILNELCNDFDTLIAPRKISRANTNILYLLFKAYAKGLETVNNTVVSLSHKFDPLRCTDEDLESVAKLVGTRKLEGSATGLLINFRNTSGEDATLEAGTYTYVLDEDSIFDIIVPINRVISNSTTVSFIAISRELRAIPVTAQNGITLTGINKLGEAITNLGLFEISCEDNAGLLGTAPETNLNFRERIVEGYTTASLFDRLREEIANLPYIFDCQLIFNNTISPLVVDTLDTGETVSIPAYHLLVMLSGNPDEKVAEIIASYGVYETTTVPTQEANVIKYENPIFINGAYDIHYMQPTAYKYGLDVLYEFDPKTISATDVKAKITTALKRFEHTNVYTPLLTERDFANYITSLNIPSVQILNVDLKDKNKQTQAYIKIPKTRLAQLDIEQLKIEPVVEE